MPAVMHGSQTTTAARSSSSGMMPPPSAIRSCHFVSFRWISEGENSAQVGTAMVFRRRAFAPPRPEKPLDRAVRAISPPRRSVALRGTATVRTVGLSGRRPAPLKRRLLRFRPKNPNLLG